MPKIDDFVYFTRWAATGLELTQKAAIPCAATAHHKLTEAYIERAAMLEKHPPVKESRPRR